MAQELSYLWGIATGYMGLAGVATSLKEFAEARRYFRQELAIDLEVGHRRWQTDTILNITQLLVAQDELEWAVELLALIRQHPAIMSVNRDRAEQRLTQLQAELSPDVFAAAVERGQARDLETSVKELIAEFSQPVESAAQPVDNSTAVPLRQESNQLLTEPLSARELDVLRLIAEGLSNAEVAHKLFISVGTVKVHTRSIYAKLGVVSRTQAVAEAQKLNLL